MDEWSIHCVVKCKDSDLIVTMTDSKREAQLKTSAMVLTAMVPAMKHQITHLLFSCPSMAGLAASILERQEGK
jgi:hypothetical protein